MINGPLLLPVVAASPPIRAPFSDPFLTCAVRINENYILIKFLYQLLQAVPSKEGLNK